MEFQSADLTLNILYVLKKGMGNRRIQCSASLLKKRNTRSRYSSFLERYNTDSIFRADIYTEIALNAFLFVNMNGHAVHQLEYFFRAHFNTLSTVRAFFHINLYVSHRLGLLLSFRQITGSEIDYVALQIPLLF